ncbi:MAG: sulfatase-like hydrolase/transferase [Candidatus Omnitrophica bacterium]|nr:sulfatase-like hydrolase/transferase [Candidatus Omnitrophota bacterium]
MNPTSTPNRWLELAQVFLGACVFGFLFSLIDLGLLSQASDFYLRVPGLSVAGKFTCFIFDFGATFFLAFLFIGFFLLREKWLSLGAIVVLAQILFLYVTSWIMFYGMGVFLDLEGVRFLFYNYRQIVLHILQINPIIFFIALGAVFLTALLFYGIVKIAHVLYRAFVPKRLTGILSLLMVCCVVTVFLGAGRELASSRDEDLRRIMRFQVSPQLSILFSFFDRRRIPVEAESPLEWEWHEQVSLEDYQKREDARIKKHPVIIIVIESLRSDVLKDGRVMPYVYALTQESVYFPHAFSTSSHSDYADPSILSSHYPLRSLEHHYYPRKIPYPRVLLYDILKAFGYKTAIFSAQNESWGNMRHYLETGSLDVFFDATSAVESLYEPTQNTGFSEIFGGFENAGKVDDRIVIREANHWISSLKKEPFFIYFNFQRSHFPYTWPDSFHPTFEPFELNTKVQFGDYPEEMIPVMKNRYWNALSYIDQQIGGFFEFLKKRGLYDEAVLIVTGDTGQSFYEHEKDSCHGGPLYNTAVSIPLLIKTPNAIEKGRRDVFVQHTDVAPSVSRLLNLTPHPSFQGESVFDHQDLSRRPIFIVAQTNRAEQDAVIWKNFKLIYDHRSGQHALYDLTLDFEEKNNLFHTEPERAERLKNVLLEWRKMQLSYYQDAYKRKIYYPPKVKPLENLESEETLSPYATMPADRFS